MLSDIAPAFLVASALTLVLGPVTLRVLRRRGIVDVPGERSSHTRVAVRGIGLAPAVAGLLAWGATAGVVSEPVLFAVVALSIGVVAAVGLVDDLTGGWPAAVRFVLVLVSSGAAVGAIGFAAVDGTKAGLLVAGGALYVVAFTNAFNFMDGIDGISVLNAVAMSAVLVVVAVRADDVLVGVLVAGLLGCAVGVAPFNLRRPAAFLGDVGSYFFGAALATVAVAVVLRGAPVDAGGALFIPYVTDTLVTFVRRKLRGARWNDPHREHAYQRLEQRGWGHRPVATGVAVLTLGCGSLGVVASTVDGTVRIGLVAIVFVLSAAYASLPDVLAATGRVRLT